MAGTPEVAQSVTAMPDYDPFEVVFAPRRMPTNPKFELAAAESTGRLIGYCRVSTADQSLNAQVDALQKEGCTKIYSEKISGTRNDRAQLKKLCYDLRPGDTVVVTRFSRISRSSRDAMKLMDAFAEAGVRFRSIEERVDTASANGRLFLAILSELSAMDHANIVSNTQAGLEAARARGRHGGRRPVIDKKKANEIVELTFELNKDRAAVARIVGVSKRTVQRFLAEKKESDAAGSDDFYEKYGVPNT